MTVSSIFVFFLGFLAACLLGVVAGRMLWVRAVRVTRARMELDRPHTLRSFEARIAGAQARAAVSIRELERALERERQISAHARLMADQMSSSSSLAQAERDDTQAALVNLAETLDSTRSRLRENEDSLSRKNGELTNMRREISDLRNDLAMRDGDVRKAELDAERLRAEIAGGLSREMSPDEIVKVVRAGNTSSVARQQIEKLRETVRTLRAEKSAAEAAATRAKLLLESRDDESIRDLVEPDEPGLPGIEPVEQPTYRGGLSAIEDDEFSETRGSEVIELDRSDDIAAKTAAAGSSGVHELRDAIDQVAVSITAEAASDPENAESVNELLDKAAETEPDSKLVTSLVEARERLRRRKSSSRSADDGSDADQPSLRRISARAMKRVIEPSASTSASSVAATLAAKAAQLGARPGPAAARNGKRRSASGSKTAVPATSGASDDAALDEAPAKQNAKLAMPRASENDLNVL
ncbi:MAG: hypothetical protein AAGH60_01940 [Pseudomonadota bacterium]